MYVGGNLKSHNKGIPRRKGHRRITKWNERKQMESTANVWQIKIMFALCVYAGRGITQIVSVRLNAWKIVDFFFQVSDKGKSTLVCVRIRRYGKGA